MEEEATHPVVEVASVLVDPAAQAVQAKVVVPVHSYPALHLVWSAADEVAQEV